MKHIRRILYATDFSATSRRALDAALTLARPQNARLTILFVLTPMVLMPEQPIDAMTIDRLESRLADGAHDNWPSLRREPGGLV